MEQYKLKFWFEHAGICIWGANEAAKEKYGYAIETALLPLSQSLIGKVNQLEDEYHTYLDWEYPPNPSPWTEEHKQDFIKRATEVFLLLCKELGTDYVVENAVNSCVL